jgi:hypothetical protein
MGRVKKKANEWGMQRVSGLREYLKLPVDHELSKGMGGEVRILPDGRVLYTLGAIRGGTTWPSREVFTEYRRRQDEEAAKGPVDSTTLLPPIDDFLRDVEAHAKSLGPRLEIPDEALDHTVASLGAVDKALKRIPLAERPVPDLVTPLVAYVGEVLRRASGGRWINPPPTYKVRTPVFDPAELAAWREAEAVGQRAFTAAQQQGRGGRAQQAPSAARHRRAAPVTRRVPPGARSRGIAGELEHLRHGRASARWWSPAGGSRCAPPSMCTSSPTGPGAPAEVQYRPAQGQ